MSNVERTPNRPSRRPVFPVLLVAFGGAVPLAACSHVPAADTVLIHCAVHTMDGDGVDEAIVVRDGLIEAVGSADMGRRYIGDETEVIDCAEGGWAVLPGFIDAHTHLVWSGTELQDVDLFSATTLDELMAPIVAHATVFPDAAWVRGAGWDISRFDGELGRGQLDAIVPDRPVYMASADAHSAWVSTLALAEAGITADTPDPVGGIIERDENGEPTGILRENAMALVEAVLPPYDDAQVDTGLEAALREANGFGLTAIVPANIDAWMLGGYRRFEDQDRLTVRVHGAVEVSPEDGADALPTVRALAATYDSPLVKVDAIKLYLDGIIETQTALMLEPYIDGTNGERLFPDEVLMETVRAFDDAGFGLHAHTLGDGAVRQMLDALEWLEEVSGPADRRPLLAHLEVIDPADVPRFAALGAYADFQPLWAYPDSYIQDLTWPVIGEERSEWLYPIGAVLAAGGTVVAGSDWSVSSMNPFEACEVAVTRMDPRDGGEVLTPRHRITVAECLAAYTRDGARAIRREEDLGRLVPGAIADLVLVDSDPFEIDPAQLSDVLVLKTFLGGRLVFDAAAQPRAYRASRRRHARPEHRTGG